MRYWEAILNKGTKFKTVIVKARSEYRARVAVNYFHVRDGWNIWNVSVKKESKNV